MRAAVVTLVSLDETEEHGFVEFPQLPRPGDRIGAWGKVEYVDWTIIPKHATGIGEAKATPIVVLR